VGRSVRGRVILATKGGSSYTTCENSRQESLRGIGDIVFALLQQGDLSEGRTRWPLSSSSNSPEKAGMSVGVPQNA